MLPLAALAVGVYFVLSPLWKVIVGALILAVAFQPVHLRVERWVGRGGLAALLSTVLVAIMIVLPLTIAISAASRELREVYLAVQHSPGGWSAALERARPLADRLSGITGMPVEEMQAYIVERAGTLAGVAAKGMSSLVAEVSTGVFHAILGLVTVFFLFRDGAGMLDRTIASLPWPHEDLDRLRRLIVDAVKGGVQGVAAVAAAQGVLTGVGFWAAGLPAPVMWSFVTAGCSVIPIVGSGLVWLGGVVVLLSRGQWLAGLVLVLWGSLVVAMVDNVVRPWVVGSRVGLNPMLVFLSLLGGVQAFGVLGLFLGPLIVSLAIAAFREITTPQMLKTGQGASRTIE